MDGSARRARGQFGRYADKLPSRCRPAWARPHPPPPPAARPVAQRTGRSLRRQLPAGPEVWARRSAASPRRSCGRISHPLSVPVEYFYRRPPGGRGRRTGDLRACRSAQVDILTGAWLARVQPLEVRENSAVADPHLGLLELGSQPVQSMAATTFTSDPLGLIRRGDVAQGNLQLTSKPTHFDPRPGSGKATSVFTISVRHFRISGSRLAVISSPPPAGLALLAAAARDHQGRHRGRAPSSYVGTPCGLAAPKAAPMRGNGEGDLFCGPRLFGPERRCREVPR